MAILMPYRFICNNPQNLVQMLWYYGFWAMNGGKVLFTNNSYVIPDNTGVVWRWIYNNTLQVNFYACFNDKGADVYLSDEVEWGVIRGYLFF